MSGTMKQAMVKAGFGAYADCKTDKEKRNWLYLNGVVSAKPIKMVRLNLGIVTSRGGVQVLHHEYAVVR